MFYSKLQKFSPAGPAWILAAACMWGILGPLSKLIMAEGVPPLEIAFWRALFGAVFFAIHAFGTQKTAIRSSDILPFVFFGIIGVALMYSSYLVAVDLVGAAIAVVLLYTAPAWVALLARLFLKEQFTPRKCTSIGLTILGCVLVSFTPGAAWNAPEATGVTSPFFWGIVAGLSTGFVYALYYIVGKKLTSSYAPQTVFFYTLTAGTLALLPFISFAPKPPLAWVYLGLLGLVTSYGAYTAYYIGLKSTEATQAIVIATLEPVVAIALACAFMGETLALSGWAGCALILGAIMYSRPLRNMGEKSNGLK